MFSLQKKHRAIIMKHYRYPQNYGLIADNSYITLTDYHDFCGDLVRLQLKIQQNRLWDLKHETQACALCCASASLMTVVLQKCSLPQVQKQITVFLAMLAQKPFDMTKLKADLQIFQTFVAIPHKVACIRLPWQVLQKLLASIQ